VRPVRAGLALVAVVVVQASVFADLPMFGVRADVVLLAVVAVAMVGGAEQGAVAGFGAGLAFDLVHAPPWPLGLSALAYCLAGYLVGRLTGGGGGMPYRWIDRSVVAAAGSVTGVVLFAGLGHVLGHGGLLDGRLVVVATVVAGVNAVLAGPAVRLARWTLAPRRGRVRLDGRLLP
jgi:rod shape-determining protein MreD